MAGHLRCDVARNLSFIECIGTVAGDVAQRIRQCRIFQNISGRPRTAISVEEIRGGCRVFFQVPLGFEQAGQAWTDGEAIVGKFDRGIE